MPEQGFTLLARPLGVSARACIYDEIKKYSYEDAVLVLPNLLMMQEARQRANCQVMSLDALAMKLLNSNGYADLKFISRRSEEIALEEVIAGLAAAGELEYFGQIAAKPGFLKSMSSLVVQLARSGADTEALASAFEAWESEEPRMRGKNADVLKIFDSYLAYLASHRLFDLEGIYRLAVRALAGEDHPPFMPFSHVYICDFYSLTPLEIDFVENLSRRCQVFMGMSFEEGMEELFEGARNTYERLYWPHVKSGGIEPCFIRAQAPDWGEGRERLLSGWGDVSVKSTCSWLDAVYASSPEEEIRCVLGRVKKELASGAACSDILIVARDLKHFAGLRRIADEYGVPVSLPETASLCSRPLSELILLALKSVPDTREGARAYISLLGSGLLRLWGGCDWEKLADMSGENYITRRSRAQALAQADLEAVSKPSAAVEEASEPSVAEAASPLAAFDSFIAAVGANQSVRGLRAKLEELLAVLDLDGRLARLCRDGELAPEAVTSCLSGRKKLLDTLKDLEQDYAACGRAESLLPLAQLTGILEDAFRRTQVIISPGRADGVTVTEAINVQGMAFKSVYILGMRRGEFPRKFSENWIYNDSERRTLEMLGICLPRAATTGDEYFFLSTALCAQEKLTLSWYVEEGKKPEEDLSPYAEDAIHIFGVEPEAAERAKSFNSSEELEAEGFFAGSLLADARAREHFAEAVRIDRLRKSRGEGSGVYMGDLEGTSVAETIRQSLKARAQLKGGSADAVFSASTLESYIKCPFAYLGEKVWREEEFREKDGRVEPQVEGSLLHDTLTYFVSGLRELEYGRKEKIPGRKSYIGKYLGDFDPQALEKELMEAFSEVAARYLEAGKLENGICWQGVEDRLRTWLEYWLKDELAETIVAPHTIAATELTFGGSDKPVAFRFEDGPSVLLEGRIDRVDRYVGESGGNDYLYVVDYKRSNTPTKKDVEGGLDLQLALYCLLAPSVLGSGVREKEGCGEKLGGGAPFAASSGLEVLKGAYLTLDKRERKEWVNFTGKNAKDKKEKQENFEPNLREHIRIPVEGILAGSFSLSERKKKCSDACPFRSICRIRVLEAEGGEENE